MAETPTNSTFHKKYMTRYDLVATTTIMELYGEWGVWANVIIGAAVLAVVLIQRFRSYARQ